MEEIDLCWRINNTGHKIIAVPQSVVYHLGGGTLDKHSPRKTFLNFRNSLLTLTKNNPSRFLFFKVMIRLILDGVAGIKFLFEGNGIHTWAIVRSHFSFYFNLRYTLQKRKEIKLLPDYSPNNKQIYHNSIVFDYYLRKKVVFSCLRRNI